MGEEGAGSRSDRRFGRPVAAARQGVREEPSATGPKLNAAEEELSKLLNGVREILAPVFKK